MSKKCDFLKKISPSEIAEMEAVVFKGDIVVVSTPEEAIAVAKKLRRSNLIGFDTETRPSFTKGVKYYTSLLQLATAKKVYVFQLFKTKIPNELAEILSDKQIIKTGVAVKDDIKNLQRYILFNPDGFVDISSITKASKMEHHGLRGLTALFFNKRLSKKQRLSNWGKDNLTESQLIYAATDAWISRKIYQKMQSIGLI